MNIKDIQEEQQISVHAYTDESGNTGNRIFDGAQPFFWTGTLLSKKDLELEGKEDLNRILKKAMEDELHGNVLGLNGIERIAKNVLQFITKYDALFIFTMVEKTHVASTKLVDTLLDNGINKAVSSFHYGIRFLRLYLTHVIVQLLSPENQVEFWQVFEKGDSKSFCKILGDLHWRVKTYVEDPRTKELLLDAILWGIDHPAELLDYTRTEHDSPNIIALSLLLGGIHEMFERTNLRIVKFIHDEQNEFAKAINDLYQILTRFKLATGPFSWGGDMQEMNTFNCPIDITESHSSVGLQIIDIVLWLTKRYTENPWNGNTECRKLVKRILKRSQFSEFSRKQLTEGVLLSLQILNNKPFSVQDEQKSKEIIKRIEDARRKRMLEESN